MPFSTKKVADGGGQDLGDLFEVERQPLVGVEIPSGFSVPLDLADLIHSKVLRNFMDLDLAECFYPSVSGEDLQLLKDLIAMNAVIAQVAQRVDKVLSSFDNGSDALCFEEGQESLIDLDLYLNILRSLVEKEFEKILRIRLEESIGDLYGRIRLLKLDELTGVTSSSDFRRLQGDLFDALNATGESFGVILLDIDYFKAVNSRILLEGGDFALQKIAHQLSINLKKKVQIIARYGGEEFIVVVPNADLDVTCNVANRLRVAVEGLDMHFVSQLSGEGQEGRGEASSVSFNCTVSCGVAVIDDEENFEALCAKADFALLASKEKGRNMVSYWNPGGGVESRASVYEPGRGAKRSDQEQFLMIDRD